MRLHRFLLSVALAGSVAASSADCATPTSITIDVYSEVPCDKRAGVVLIGSTALDSLPSKVPSATSTHCDPNGGMRHMGSVVVIPAANKDSPIAFASMTTVDGSPADGCLQNPTNCIVAKRQLHFIPRTELTMRIDLRLSCVNVVCGADQTCSKGQCVSATLDLKGCANSTCDENALGPRPDPPAPKTIDFITYPDGAVGTTEQLHLVYAAHSKRWWLFYFETQAAIMWLTPSKPASVANVTALF